MMVKSPVVSSIRSRQTGHVGSSVSAGVGGGAGFVDNCKAELAVGCKPTAVLPPMLGRRSVSEENGSPAP